MKNKKSVDKRNTPMTPLEAIKAKRKEALGRRDLTSFIIRLIGLILFIWLIFCVVFKLVPAKNEDMKPSIRARDLQVVYTLDKNYRLSDVVYYSANGKERTGRVVGVPGDTIEITKDNQLKVNGNVTTFANVFYETPAYDTDITYPLTLGNDEYFILSDFREGAEDSRAFGPVKLSDTHGKVILVIRRNGI